MNGFTIFNDRLFGNNEDINWFGKKGIVKLDDERRATIRLTTNGTVDEYEGYEVAIKNKEEGTVDLHCFMFDEYFTPNDNVSNRDWDLNGYRVLAYVSKDWHLNVPSNEVQDRFVEEILDYIHQWN